MKKKILLVDDERDLVTAVTFRLNAEGYDVISALDGQAALDMAKKEKPDLIILDLMLPKLNGYKVCSLLKADMRYRRIPIIMFTARVQEADKKMGLEAGADAYITKPFEASILLAKVKEFLGEEAGA